MLKLVECNNADRKELDWQGQYEALIDARRLVKHHPDTIKAALHEFVRAVAPVIDQLRSSTSKNAIVLFQVCLSGAGLGAWWPACGGGESVLAAAVQQWHLVCWRTIALALRGHFRPRKLCLQVAAASLHYPPAFRPSSWRPGVLIPLPRPGSTTTIHHPNPQPTPHLTLHTHPLTRHTLPRPCLLHTI